MFHFILLDFSLFFHSIFFPLILTRSLSSIFPKTYHTRLCLWIHYCLLFSLSLSLFLAGVVDNLQTGGFFNDKVTKSCLFSTVHDAVLHCQSARMHSHDEGMNYCVSMHTCTQMDTSYVTK